MQAQVRTMRHILRTDRREQVQGTDNMDMQELRQDNVKGVLQWQTITGRREWKP